MRALRRAVNLRRRAGIVVAERDVGGPAGFRREAQADQVRAASDRANRFRCRTRTHRRRAAARATRRTAPASGSLRTRPWRRMRGIQRLRPARRRARSRLRCARAGSVRSRRRPRAAFEFPQRLLEAVARVQYRAVRRRGVAQHQSLGARSSATSVLMVVSVRLSGRRGNAARRFSPILPLDLLRVRDHAVERTVFAQPLRRGLRAALVDARHVVDLSPISASKSTICVRRARRTCRSRRRPSRRLPLIVLTSAMRGPHQLGEVLVAGGDRDVDALRRRCSASVPITSSASTPSMRRIGMPSAWTMSHIGCTCARRSSGIGGAVGLVLGIQVVAEGLARRVHHEGDVVGLLLQRRAQHVDHAEQRTGGLAGVVGERRERMERAVEVAGTVDQDQLGIRGF